MSQTVFEDDPSIQDTVRLFRRIHPVHIVKDDDTGLLRFSTAAFRDEDLSINIEEYLLRQGLTSIDCLRGYPQHLLMSLQAGACRRLNQAVCHDPKEHSASHGLVYGNKNRKTQLWLVDLAQWVHPPEAPEHLESQN